MGRKQRLSEYERGLIDAYDRSGLTRRAIGKRINRSHTVVSNYLNNKENYGVKYGIKNRKPLTLRQKRQFLRTICTEGKSIMESKVENGITLSKTTLWKYCKSESHLKYIKRKSAPKLSSDHKSKRMEWCRQHMSFGNNWRKIIFSDEKKFNLDGPDGYQFHWHDMRREPEYFSKRAFGGGSLMVWAAIGYNGKTELVFINGKQNSIKYKETLIKYLIPFTTQITGDEWVFQQDNCPFHVSNYMKQWFIDENIDVIDWPALSPDLNIIENLWSELTRRVYANGRQFATVEDLRRVLIEEWEGIPKVYVQKLFDSMDNRIFEVIKSNGQTIDY